MISRDKLTWKGKDIYLGKQKTGYGILYTEDPNFWRVYVKWPDGTKSQDFYNLSRAKDHAMKIAIKELNLELGTDDTGGP